MKDDSKEINPLEDTDRIQKAIEEAIDQESAALPLLPVLDGQSDDMLAAASAPDAAPQAAAPPAEPPVHSWFFTFMCMNIPVVGWFYLFYLAFSKKKTPRQNFARAYLYYKLLFLIIAAVILGITICIGMDLLDQLLAYMEML